MNLDKLDEIIARKGAESRSLIAVLQEAQEYYGYLPKEVLQAVAKRLKVPLSRVYGVVTFYSQFCLTRRGKVVIKLCDGTACHVKGAPKTIDYLRNEKGLEPGGTTPDYGYTLSVVYCLGACALAPTLYLNDQVVTNATAERLAEKLKSSEKAAEKN